MRASAFSCSGLEPWTVSTTRRRRSHSSVEIRVRDFRDFRAARAWYVQLLGEPSFVAHDTEEVWELAENRSIAVEEQPEHAGHSAVTVFVDDLDKMVDAIVAREIEPTMRETFGNGVRKVPFHDPDGNEIGFGGAPL